MPDAVLERVAARFRVLGATSRLKILNALMGGEMTVGDLLERTGLEASNLSRHLAALEKGGCVHRSRKGREVVVGICDPSLRALCDTVCGSLKAQIEAEREAFRNV